MKTLLIPIALGVAILVLTALFGLFVLPRLNRAPAEPERWPYRPRSVMSEAEQMLYEHLRLALPEHLVLAQVGLSRVLEVKAKQEEWFNWWAKISQKSLDFVICHKDTTVVAAIELDDSSHNKKGRKERDQDKDRALTDAGIKIIRWQARNPPSVETIRAAILQ